MFRWSKNNIIRVYMDHPFSIIVSDSEDFFRGRKNIHDISEGYWYALDSKTANIYGSNIGIYKSTRNLRLINLASKSFHNDFMDKLNLKYPGINNAGFDLEKIKLLIPLGLPDFDIQREFVRIFGIPLEPLNQDNKGQIFSYKLLQGVSRFSEINLDKLFALQCKEFYSTTYDGFISKYSFTNMTNNTYFHPEMCNFDPSCMKYKEDLHSMPGGGNKTYIHYKPYELWKSQTEMDAAFKKAYAHIEESYYSISFQLNGAMMEEANSVPKNSKKYTRKKYRHG